NILASPLFSFTECISCCTRNITPSPSSPLFPYTTLFRSLGPPDRARARSNADPRYGSALSFRSDRCLFLCFDRLGATARYLLAEDRKSTRLNSSHGSISYAVFCLKKKIKHNSNTIYHIIH